MQIVKLERPEFDAQIEPFEKYRNLEIKTDDDANFLSDRCKELKDLIDATEKQRKKYTAPLDDLKKEMIHDERAITDPLRLLMKIFKAKIARWLTAQEDARRQAAETRRQAEIKRLEAEKQKQIIEAVETDTPECLDNAEEISRNIARLEARPLSVDTAARGEAGVTSLLTRWKFEIIDQDQIPRQFMIPDLQALGKLARLEKDKAKVPGVRFYMEKTVAQR